MHNENVGRLAAALALVVTACGGSGDGTGSSTNPNQNQGGPGGAPTTLGGLPPGGGAAGMLTGQGGIVVVSGGAGAPAQGGAPPVGGAPPMSAGGAPPGGAPPTGTGGGGPVTPPPPAGQMTVQINMTPFTINPGSEVFMCQNYDNPFGGKDVAIQRSESNMTPGSHHLHLFYGATDATRTVASCSGFEFHPLLHGAQTPNAVSQYPAGMAAKLNGATGVRLQVHYLNSTSNALSVQANVQLTTVDPSTVDKWVAQLYFNRVGLVVAPGPNVSVTTTCTIASSFGPIGLLGGVSHMHRRATHFVASTSTGVPLYETTQWDEPTPTAYNPPVALNPGDSISWTCTYNNDTGQYITFGDSASTNEMCIFTGRFYSSPTGSDMECQSQGATGQAVENKAQ